MSKTSTVSILAEIPEALHEEMQRYLEQNKGWDGDRLMVCAIALFLVQNGKRSSVTARTYLDSLLGDFDGSVSENVAATPASAA